MTITKRPNEHLWVEAYRPTVIEDCILQERTKKEVTQIVSDGTIPNLLFFGPPGCGKTTLAKAMADQAKTDWLLINGSNERGVDVIRNKIVSFASTSSLSGNDHKVVIIDESDRLSMLAQEAFKAEVEKFSKTCTFILTANQPNLLVDALHSRFTGVDFTPKKDEIERMQVETFMRVCEILDAEHVTHDDAVLIEVIQRFFPDVRRILGVLQQYARAGNDINAGLLMYVESADVDALVTAIQSKKFKEIAQWSANNAANETSGVYEKIYRKLKEFIEPSSIPDAIMILEEYQRWDATVPSKELHLTALATELMTSLTFK